MKGIASISTILLTAGLLASCNGTDSEIEKKDCVFESLTASQTYSLKNSAKDYGYRADVTVNDSVDIIIPVKLNGLDVSVLRDSIEMRMFGMTSDNLETSLQTWMEDSRKESGYETEPVDISATNVDGFQLIQGRIVNMTTEVLSYCIATSVYHPGAANGLETLDYLNYSLVLNRMITLKDIFTEKGLDELPAVIDAEAQTNPKYAGIVSIDSLPQNGNFFLSSEGLIVFSYQPMEVGPHNLGNVQISFEPVELVRYLTPEAIRNYDLDDIVD